MQILEAKRNQAHTLHPHFESSLSKTSVHLQKVAAKIAVLPFFPAAEMDK
jgi:hypothetical protein